MKTKNYYQTVTITLTNGLVGKFVGPAFAHKGLACIVQTEFSKPYEIPPGWHFEILPVLDKKKWNRPCPY